MPKELPAKWRTLNIRDDLGIRRNGVPADLRIFKRSGSPNLYASFLPAIEDDPRPNQGRTKGGKRKVIDGSM